MHEALGTLGIIAIVVGLMLPEIAHWFKRLALYAEHPDKLAVARSLLIVGGIAVVWVNS